MSRLLVVRLGSLGDLVHALPAVAAIHRAHPSTEIDWLVDAVHRDFLALVPMLSSIVVLTDRTARAWFEARTAMRARQYEIAIDFQGLLKSAALARLSGAPRVVGFDTQALRERSAAPFYTERVDVGEGHHVVNKNMKLAAALGASTDVIEFPIRSSPSDALAEVRGRGLSEFALINCCAAWPNKRWPPDRFGRTATWLRSRHGFRSIALWGPGEREIAEEVVRVSDGAAILAPPTGLADLVELSKAASLMISGDTGPTHIAAAVGTPVVWLFGPTNPSRNGPWRPEDVSLSRYDSCDCHYERRCRRDLDRWCLGDITETELQDAIDRRLAGRAAV